MASMSVFVLFNKLGSPGGQPLLVDYIYIYIYIYVYIYIYIYTYIYIYNSLQHVNTQEVVSEEPASAKARPAPAPLVQQRVWAAYYYYDYYYYYL